MTTVETLVLVSWEVSNEDSVAVLILQIRGGAQNHAGVEGRPHEVPEVETRRVYLSDIASLRIVEHCAGGGGEQVQALLKPRKRGRPGSGFLLFERRLQGDRTSMTKLVATVMALQEHPGHSIHLIMHRCHS